jgi:hypothetical protein
MGTRSNHFRYSEPGTVRWVEKREPVLVETVTPKTIVLEEHDLDRRGSTILTKLIRNDIQLKFTTRVVNKILDLTQKFGIMMNQSSKQANILTKGTDVITL